MKNYNIKYFILSVLLILSNSLFVSNIYSNVIIINKDSITLPLNTEPNTNGFSEINNAIRTGNANELAKYFNTSIELILTGNNSTYSKTQAEMIIRDFFNKNQPKNFTIGQEGTSNDGSKFTIGTYTTKNNKTYRVYYVVKKVAAKELIHLLEFDEK